MDKAYYELRYIETSPYDDSLISLFDQKKRRLTLPDLINSEDYIFLLGNPGSGKTTELENVFHKIWNDRQQNQVVPLSINIKNFRTSSIIEDLIKVDNWKELPAIVFIIDGLDEISNIQDFISALQNFIRDNDKLKLKFIISCRTNIYQKSLVDVPGFKVVYLKNLTDIEVEDIFSKKYGIQVSDAVLSKFYTVLQVPFNINLFALYFEKEDRFPETVKIAWELVINEELNVTMARLLKKQIELSKPEIFSLLQKVAFANELMQQTAIAEEDLFSLVDGIGIAVLGLVPFIERAHGDISYYTFRHKNYQEYFASKYIASQNTDKIIDYIKVDGYQKIKPSLFNTTTFLLNILEGEKLEKLIDWLLENEIEILFFADENRLRPVLQNQIFEKYFTELCINKTFWITHFNRISLETFAKFADFNFLLNQSKNTDIPERARISAIEVLGNMSIEPTQKIELKSDFLSFLTTESAVIKSEVLRTIKILGFHRDDPAYCSQVLDIATQFVDSDITYQVISILSDLDDEQRNKELLISLIKTNYSMQDNSIRNMESLIANILLTTKSVELHLQLLKIFFSDQFSLRASAVFFDNFDELLIQRALLFREEDSNYAKQLVELAFSEPYMIASNDLLKTMLTRIGLSPELTIHILKTQKMSSDVLYTITQFLTIDSIDAIVTEYSGDNLKFATDEDISRFRNWLSNTDYEKGLYLEEKFVTAGHQFSTPLPTKADSEKYNEEYKAFQIYNFNLLFNRHRLCDEVANYYLTNSFTTLNRKDYQKILFAWYDDKGYHGIQYSVHAVLDAALRFANPITAGEVCELLNNNPYFYISVIKAALSHFSLRTIVLQPAQITLMTDLVNSVRKQIRFNRVVETTNKDDGSYRLYESFQYIKIVLYFDLNYNIIQDTEFYLNALAFGNLEGYQSKNSTSFTEHVIERVGDLNAVNEKIVDNINSNDLILMAKSNHFIYAIENDLKNAFDKIGKELLEDRTLIDQNKILGAYTEKIDDPVSFLRACCSDPKSFFYWEAIRLIKEKYRDDTFILEAALVYLKTDDIDFIENAVNVLFFLNQDIALNSYYHALIKIIAVHPDTSGFTPRDFMNYTNLSELVILIDIFKLISMPATYNTFYLHSTVTFLNTLISWLCSTENGYNELYKILLIISNDHTYSDNDKHYINDLITTADLRHFESKSKKLSFDHTLSLLNS